MLILAMLQSWARVFFVLDYPHVPTFAATGYCPHTAKAFTLPSLLVPGLAEVVQLSPGEGPCDRALTI